MDADSCSDDAERFLATGNDLADKGAKAAVALHPGINQILVNTAVKPIRSEDYVADIRFSGGNVRDLRSGQLPFAGLQIMTPEAFLKEI